MAWSLWWKEGDERGLMHLMDNESKKDEEEQSSFVVFLDQSGANAERMDKRVGHTSVCVMVGCTAFVFCFFFKKTYFFIVESQLGPQSWIGKKS